MPPFSKETRSTTLFGERWETLEWSDPSFSGAAKEEARQLASHKRVVLIDGDELARLMIENEIGQRFRFLMKDGPEATEARRVSGHQPSSAACTLGTTMS